MGGFFGGGVVRVRRRRRGPGWGRVCSPVGGAVGPPAPWLGVSGGKSRGLIVAAAGGMLVEVSVGGYCWVGAPGPGRFVFVAVAVPVPVRAPGDPPSHLRMTTERNPPLARTRPSARSPVQGGPAATPARPADPLILPETAKTRAHTGRFPAICGRAWHWAAGNVGGSRPFFAGSNRTGGLFRSRPAGWLSPLRRLPALNGAPANDPARAGRQSGPRLEPGPARNRRARRRTAGCGPSAIRASPVSSPVRKPVSAWAAEPLMLGEFGGGQVPGDGDPPVVRLVGFPTGRQRRAGSDQPGPGAVVCRHAGNVTRPPTNPARPRFPPPADTGPLQANIRATSPNRPKTGAHTGPLTHLLEPPGIGWPAVRGITPGVLSGSARLGEQTGERRCSSARRTGRSRGGGGLPAGFGCRPVPSRRADSRAGRGRPGCWAVR